MASEYKTLHGEWSWWIELARMSLPCDAPQYVAKRLAWAAWAARAGQFAEAACALVGSTPSLPEITGQTLLRAIEPSGMSAGRIPMPLARAIAERANAVYVNALDLAWGYECFLSGDLDRVEGNLQRVIATCNYRVRMPTMSVTATSDPQPFANQDHTARLRGPVLSP